MAEPKIKQQTRPKTLPITHVIISKFGYDYIPLNHRGLPKNRESGNT